MLRTDTHRIRFLRFAPLAVAVFSAGALAGAAHGQASRNRSSGAQDSAQVIHLLNRATFGVRPGDITTVLEMGRDKWLDSQLHPDRIRDTLSAALDQRFPITTMSMRELYQEYARQPKPKKADPADTTMSAASAQPRRAANPTAKQAGAQGRNSPQAMLAELAAAKLERAAFSDRQLEEVMTDFWFNHFNVFFQKGADRYLVGDYERTAIRPYVFGKFEDMLVATAQHPAMLFYLDNWQSVHVDSTARGAFMQRARQPQGAAKNQTRGLNENYARELMELHTLGVDAGYTQKDVIEVARALTGWTFVQPRPTAIALAARSGRNARRAPANDDVEFVFREALHDRGEKTILGHTLPPGRGIEDGRDVLHILATAPATAHYIAGKLVEYFVSDKPDPTLVAHVAATFTKTHGDLREVTRTLFSDPLFYSTANEGAKIKTPFQLMASTMRVTNATMVNPRGAMQTLKTLGQLPYMSSPPTGYPARSDDWVNSGALLARMNFGIDYASGKVAGMRPDARTLFGGISPGNNAVHSLLETLLPGVNTSQLEKAIVTDVTSQQDTLPNPRAKAARIVGLALGSPEFQRH